MASKKHPRQPFVMDEGVVRFHKNPIVDYLYRKSGSNTTDIVLIAEAGGFSREDMQQFYQLVGHSVSFYAAVVKDRAHAAEVEAAAEIFVSDITRRAIDTAVARVKSEVRE